MLASLLSPHHHPHTHTHTQTPDYGFAYSDDDVAEEDADIENAYYGAKGALEDAGGGDDGARAALAGFQDVLAMDEAGGARGDWSFKALKQVRGRGGCVCGVRAAGGRRPFLSFSLRGAPENQCLPLNPPTHTTHYRSSSCATAWARRTP